MKSLTQTINEARLSKSEMLADVINIINNRLHEVDDEQELRDLVFSDDIYDEVSDSLEDYDYTESQIDKALSYATDIVSDFTAYDFNENNIDEIFDKIRKKYKVQ